MTTEQKALDLNLDPSIYGTLAEIGAGQEVAAWLFHVGGAAGTIAKSMSAYDMTFSDQIYGAAPRYVSRERLLQMLDHEFHLLQERLQHSRGVTSRFFVLANTMKTRSYRVREDGAGWMGLRFQHQPQAPCSQILIHLRLLDEETILQQRALGIVGINLLHAAYFSPRVAELIGKLVDEVTTRRIHINFIEFSGPAFPDVDNRLACLELVRQGLSSNIVVNSTGCPIPAGELLYRKAILCIRGSFQPVSNLHLDLIHAARQCLEHDFDSPPGHLITLPEITLQNLSSPNSFDPGDILARIECLNALDLPVMITQCPEFYRLASILHRYSKDRLAFIMGGAVLLRIFQEKFYEDLQGGILEAFGRLLKQEVRLMIYPFYDPETQTLHSLDDLRVPHHLRLLFRHLRENGWIEPLPCINPQNLQIKSSNLLREIQSNSSLWTQSVPPKVAQLIRQNQWFQYPKSQQII